MKLRLVNQGLVLVLAGLILGSPAVRARYSGGMWHAVRLEDGSWEPFGDVEERAGNNLHVVITTQ
jgi:hypothetical protein